MRRKRFAPLPGYPIVVDVDAKKRDVYTGVVPTAGQKITFETDPKEKWTANPASGMYDANGSPFAAKTGYTYPAGTEGALVGSIGPQTFQIGKQGYVISQVKGQELLLQINDDRTGLSGGPGYYDNIGRQLVTITVYDPFPKQERAKSKPREKRKQKTVMRRKPRAKVLRRTAKPSAKRSRKTRTSKISR